MKNTPIISTFLLIFLTTSISYSQEMTMFLGVTGYQYYEDDRLLITAEVNSLLNENKEAYKYWKKSRTFNTIAVSSNVVAPGTTIAILARDENNKAPASLVGASIGSTLISIIFYLSANTQKKKAVLTYNKGLKHKPLTRIKPLINKDGVGMYLQF